MKAKPKTAAPIAPRQCEVREIGKLKPYANNSRTHSPEQIDALMASFEQFGFTIPLLIDEHDVVLAGHGRLLAAEKRGSTHVPVIVARGWSAEQKRAYVIADNRLTEGGGWNRQLLGTELGNLMLADFDMNALGFAPGEIAQLVALSQKLEVDPDDAPALAPDPVTQPGDLWLLGKHRVLCGDATSAAAVERVMAGAAPLLMVTDPPYGVKYEPDWRGKALKDGRNRAEGKVQNDSRSDWREAWALFPGHVAYVWHSGKFSGPVDASLTACRFIIRAQIVWVKQIPIFGRGDYHWQHEAVYYAVKEGEPEHIQFDEGHEVLAYAVKVGEAAGWVGGRKQTTVWNIEVVKNDTGHGTQKPIECMRRPMVNNSKGGDLVYDPFLGTGTTLIAAQMIGRVCIGLELDPAYVDVIVRRWAAVTGEEPVHETTGKTFEQMREARSGKKPRKG